MTEQATIEAVPQLGEGFKGEVIAPGDPGYDDARNLTNSKCPAGGTHTPPGQSGSVDYILPIGHSLM